ncbi:hypothetical protein M758_11G151500 [Ceratodon purpureus]|nr:hypothetical protein M758_11G151500 [Ceratodon purpureus]
MSLLVWLVIAQSASLSSEVVRLKLTPKFPSKPKWFFAVSVGSLDEGPYSDILGYNLAWV